MNTFFYRHWWLYYLLFFLLLGLLIYALLWSPSSSRYETAINELKYQLQECRNSQTEVYNSPSIRDNDLRADNKINCNSTVKSGGQGVTNTQHELGNTSGTVVIEYDTKQVPDEIKVYYDNVIVAQSNGLVRGVGKLRFKYNATAGKPTFCNVIVSAPEENTQWDYLLNCPQ